MNYDDWELGVSAAITGDSLWKMEAYRLALFLGDISWRDVNKLFQDKRVFSLADQLYRSVGSIGANLAEGYSRGTGRDRARFYEYALGSVRESRDWYYKARHILGENVVEHRLNLLAALGRLLLTMIPQQRGKVLRENGGMYQVSFAEDVDQSLLSNIPFAG